MVASTPLSHQTPLNRLRLRSISFYLHCFPQIARIHADYFSVQKQARQLAGCTPTSHEIPATSQRKIFSDKPGQGFFQIFRCINSKTFMFGDTYSYPEAVFQPPQLFKRLGHFQT
jgi:hypothetical protein